MSNRPHRTFTNRRVLDLENQSIDCKEECKTCPSIGSFNRLTYDNCEYSKHLQESTSPLMYMMSRYKYENCGVCTYDGKLWAPFDLVDYESELLNITRPNSKCPDMKYDPRCPRSPMCISTFDSDWPVVYAPDVCPVVCNNIKKMMTPGYVLHERAYCGRPLSEEEKRKRYQMNKYLRGKRSKYGSKKCSQYNSHNNQEKAYSKSKSRSHKKI